MYLEDKLSSNTVLNIDTPWCYCLKDTPRVISLFKCSEGSVLLQNVIEILAMSLTIKLFK